MQLQVKVGFDSWPACYDYWVSTLSTNLRPVGYCERYGLRLEPPRGKKQFDWSTYLEATSSMAAPGK